MRPVFALVLMAACTTSSRRPPPDPPPAEPPISLEMATAYERGDGVPRDYARAAEIYDTLCHDGAGDLVACDRLLDAIEAARGTASDGRRMYDLMNAACGHDDVVLCYRLTIVDALIANARRHSHADPPVRIEGFAAIERRLEAACERGDHRACKETIGYAGEEGDDEWKQREYAAAACRDDVLEACIALIFEATMCGSVEIDDEAGCLGRQVAEWKRHDYDADSVEAWDRVVKACDAGDALACDEIPGRAIAPEALCAAHDYGACGAMGCLGDDAAEKLASEMGANPKCGLAEQRAMKAWMKLRAADPANAPLPPVVADRMDPIGKRPTTPFRAVHFHAYGGRDASGWPRIEASNIHDEGVVELRVCAYAYDDQETLVARFQADARIAGAIAPNSAVMIELAGLGADPLPRTGYTVVVDYDRVRFTSAAAGHEDLTRCPASRALADGQFVLGGGWI